MAWDKITLILFFTIAQCSYITATAIFANRGGCRISVHRDFPESHEPFLLKKTVDGSDFLLPTLEKSDDVFHVNTHDSFYVACPPTGSNYLNATHRPVQEVVCEGKNMLSVDNEMVNFKMLSCQWEVKQSVKNSKIPCARNKGTLIEIGFDALGWHEIITICHNLNQGHSYYTLHTVRTELIKGGTYKRSQFKKEASFLFKGYDPNVYYKRTNQKALFQRFFGEMSSQYVNDVQYLSRGHLSPVRDFALKTSQKFTFAFSNAAPQWMSINGGLWKHVEMAVRNNRKAKLYEVSTGTFGDYTVKTKNGKEVKVSLHNGQLPVPAYYWKIVQDPMDKSCIALVCTNDPFLSTPPAPICKNICPQNNWFVDMPQKNLTHGFVYCCSYADFKHAVIDVPYFDCKKTLHYV